jgi:SAM-dependent methyltransferase
LVATDGGVMGLMSDMALHQKDLAGKSRLSSILSDKVHMKETMNTFIHRLLKSSTASSIKSSKDIAHLGAVTNNLLDEIQNAKLIYFGEFHSETRIISFQTELVKEWSKRLGSACAAGVATKPRLHLIMEHFSVDMQDLLNKYQCLDSVDDYGGSLPISENQEAFDQLVASYKAIGTEGHDLLPYSDLLQFCRETTTKQSDGDSCCEVLLHGGFIPRNHAARLNKECPDEATKRLFFDEMSNDRGYLPKKGDAMCNALFETASDTTLRGPKEHKMLIQSLMSGTDLYSPVDASNDDAEAEDADDEEKPFDRLYQAQLLKDHAMGYKVANFMLDQPSSDRFLVIAGFGHLKHYLGVPDCVNHYLRQTAMLDSDEKRRAKAMDLLMDISRFPTTAKSRNADGKGSALIGCQMLYEAYLEDNYPPLVAQISKASELDGDADTDEIKQRMIKHIYVRDPATLDEYILKSDEVRGPFLNYNQGIGGFEHPCADYLFVYDEDDEHILTETDLAEASNSDQAKCPYHTEAANDDAKRETLEAYQQVGQTAGFKGNAKRARAIMSILGYTENDLAYLGDGDIYNFQGVANPHSVAKIQLGESVIDIGSGLGIDSFLAMRDCGADQNGANANSFVVGVDLAPSEVQHATKRAAARGYRIERLRFIHGDVEKLQDVLSKHDVPPENSFDVCISNGAFCLVPDKKKAFQNGKCVPREKVVCRHFVSHFLPVFNALRPGGRCAISTTTIVSDHLDPSFEWPVCMRMFASLESLEPMLEEIGFKNVQILDAESPMEGMELPEDDVVDDNADGIKRFKIHGKYVDQFAFLEKMDMDELCKVVTVYGEKP